MKVKNLPLSLSYTHTESLKPPILFIEFPECWQRGKVWIPYKTQAACAGKSRRPFYPVTLAALQAWAGELKIYLR